MRQLLSFCRKLLGLDDPVTRLSGDEARVVEQRPVKPDQGRDPADLELLKRPEHSTAGMLSIDVVDDQFRHERVVEIRDDRAGRDPGIDPHSRPRRLAVARDPPRAGQKAAGRVFGVDPALDRVAD